MRRLQRSRNRVIERVQDSTPGEQILGTAVALMAMCESANVHLGDVLTFAGRVMHDAEGPFTSHVQAVRDFAAGEIRRGESAHGLRG